jgi:diguanylate cyclase (GGDEF)-like protein
MTSAIFIPATVSLLLLLVFTYLYEQSKQPYFRAWQIAWTVYTLHYFFSAWNVYFHTSAVMLFLSAMLLGTTAICLVISTRLLRQKFSLRWFDVALFACLMGLSIWNAWREASKGASHIDPTTNPHFLVDWFVAALLVYCAIFFYRHSYRKGSLAFTFLALSVGLWAGFMILRLSHRAYLQFFGVGGHMFGAVPQMLLGISMVMVLSEYEREVVQENALAFSTISSDPTGLLTSEDVLPSMQNLLDRLVSSLQTSRSMIYISERWRAVLPTVQREFSEDFISRMERTGAGEYLSDLAYKRGGLITLRNVREMSEPLPAFPGARFEQLREIMGQENVRNLTAVSLQTRERIFGVIMFSYAERRVLGTSKLRLLNGLALQISLALENYAVMHEAQRRTKEYELLTQIGQAISSHLDQDEIFTDIQKELGQIFDTDNFFIAFQEGDQIRFELEVAEGKILPKRTRKAENSVSEYVIRTGEPLLVRCDMEQVQERLGVRYTTPGRVIKSFCGAPIFIGGRPLGVMAALSPNREYVYEHRDLEVMQTAAGQVSVAVENARLFQEEQRRSRQLSFLNNVSKMAISSESSEQMLVSIVSEIQKNFHYDHIGIGIFDYVSKDVEIKAEAGSTNQALGKRIPLGTGILGRVARTGEKALVQSSDPSQLQGVIPGSRSVLCIPVTYGETLLGVLNVESRKEDAFSPQDTLIMNTMADLLATALHNAFVFQKLQQQSITDGLTGLKTRRYFWEALSSEWKRAARSGRPFSVVIMDLDKFKEVNDTMGHLEGDLVLARVGRILEQKSRQSNIVARYGGDEFIILMPETGAEQAQILAERLRLWIATDPMLSQQHITGSFGVGSFPVHGASAEEIIRVADAGMYVSKHAGGDRVSTIDEAADAESLAMQRQMIAGYIEGFLHREHTGLEHLEELIATLKKLCGGEKNLNVDLLRDSIESLTHAAEARELNAGGHGEMTSRYAEVLGRAISMAPDQLADLQFVARIHDVGKIFVPERVLNKMHPLSDDEFYLLKSHTRIGSEIIATLPRSEALAEAIAHHHEAFDGSGYPNGLRGEQIPLWSRIILIADAYANMTTERSFGPAKSSEQALAELEKLSGVRYDGMLVRILIRELRAERASWTLGN